jgi:hypothetical protein
MQLIDMPTGRYCIADGRDLGAFLKALKTASKPKRPRLSTARPVRRFPWPFTRAKRARPTMWPSITD